MQYSDRVTRCSGPSSSSPSCEPIRKLPPGMNVWLAAQSRIGEVCVGTASRKVALSAAALSAATLSAAIWGSRTDAAALDEVGLDCGGSGTSQEVASRTHATPRPTQRSTWSDRRLIPLVDAECCDGAGPLMALQSTTARTEFQRARTENCPEDWGIPGTGPSRLVAGERVPLVCCIIVAVCEIAVSRRAK